MTYSVRAGLQSALYRRAELYFRPLVSFQVNRGIDLDVVERSTLQ